MSVDTLIRGLIAREGGSLSRGNNRVAVAAIGARIRLARARAGWTQQDLAIAIGAETATVSKLEAGLMQPTTVRLQEIADVLGVPLREQAGRRTVEDVEDELPVRPT